MSGRTRTWWPALPALLVSVGLFGLGVLLAFAQSVGALSFVGPPRFDLGVYADLLASGGFWRSLGLSVWIAAASTLLAGAGGLGLALALRAARAGPALRWLAGVTLPVPHVVAALVTALVWSQSGLAPRALHALGLIAGPQDFPEIVFDPRGAAVILELVWKETPFVGLSVLAALATLDPGEAEVARTLGASRARRFAHTVWPRARGALLAPCLLVFAYAFASFEVPLLLGATAPTTLAVEAYRAYGDADLARRAEAMALSVLVAVAGTLLVLAYARLARRAP